LLDRPVLPGSDGDHAGVDVGALGKATRHDDRRARRNVAAELGKAREMIGMHRLTAGVVLVDAHGVREIRAELLERAAHALQDIVGFAPQRRAPAQRLPGRPSTSGASPRSKSKASWPLRKIHGPALTAWAKRVPLPASASTDLAGSAAVGVTLVRASPGWTMASFKPPNAGPRAQRVPASRLSQRTR